MSQKQWRRGFKRDKYRMRLVFQLAELGFSISEISSVGNYSLQTVKYDIVIFKKKGQLPENKQSQNFDFRLFFKFFSRSFFSKKHNSYETKLFYALAHTNVLKRLNIFAQSLEFIATYLGNPFAREDDRYKKLYGDIFGLEEHREATTRKSLSVSLIKILDQVNHSLEINSEEEVRNLLFENIVDPFRAGIAVQQWSHDLVASRFKDALNILHEREAKIIRMHYGIGYDRSYIFSEMRDAFGLSAERINKIERKAFGILRKNQKSLILREIGETVGELKAKYEKTREENTNLKEENTRLRARINHFSKLEELEMEKADTLYRQEKVLSMAIEQLEISIRAYNCFDRSNIKTIRDLVQKTENEMLAIKNFGMVTLNEMKGLLQSISQSQEIELHFGMKFYE